MSGLTPITVAQARLLRQNVSEPEKAALDKAIAHPRADGTVLVDTTEWKAFSASQAKALATPWQAGTPRANVPPQATVALPSVDDDQARLKKLSPRDLAGVYLYAKQTGDKSRAQAAMDELVQRSPTQIRQSLTELQNEADPRAEADVAKLRADPKAEVDLAADGRDLDAEDVLFSVMRPLVNPNPDVDLAKYRVEMKTATIDELSGIIASHPNLADDRKQVLTDELTRRQPTELMEMLNKVKGLREQKPSADIDAYLQKQQDVLSGVLRDVGRNLQ